MTQKIKLIVTDSGDSSVGINSFYEEVTVSFKYGKHDKETLDMIEQSLKETLGSLLTNEVTAKVESVEDNEKQEAINEYNERAMNMFNEFLKAGVGS